LEFHSSVLKKGNTEFLSLCPRNCEPFWSGTGLGLAEGHSVVMYDLAAAELTKKVISFSVGHQGNYHFFLLLSGYSHLEYPSFLHWEQWFPFFPPGVCESWPFFKILGWVCGEWIMRRLWELDISKARCSSAAFQRCLSVVWDWHSSGHRRWKCRTAASPKLFKFREAGTQVSPVTMSCPPWQLLHPVYH
jgi:hypothetical protein